MPLAIGRLLVRHAYGPCSFDMGERLLMRIGYTYRYNYSDRNVELYLHTYFSMFFVTTISDGFTVVQCTDVIIL